MQAMQADEGENTDENKNQNENKEWLEAEKGGEVQAVPARRKIVLDYVSTAT